MSTYRINGHELTGTDEAISQLKDLLLQHTNDKCLMQDRIENLECAAEVVVAKFNQGELSAAYIHNLDRALEVKHGP